MHIIGTWSASENPDTGGLKLELSPEVRLIEDDASRIAYQGAIYDKSDREILGSQSALDTAFGLFTYVKTDKTGNDIVIGTDRLGFSPLYYSIRDETLFFSTSLTLLKYRIDSYTPDLEAWEELLNLYTILGDKTTIKEIKRLGYGTRIHISDGRISFEHHWTPEPPEMTDKKDFVKTSNRLLMEALEHTRDMPNPKVVLMSGGEDSRRIGVTAHSMGFPVTFATQQAGIALKGDQSTRIAKEVAECLVVPFILENPPTDAGLYADLITRDYWLGYESQYHDWVLPITRVIPSRSLIYDGMAGDVTVNAHWVRLFPDIYRMTSIDDMAREISSKDYAFKIDTSRLDSSLFERVREQLAKLPDCPARLDYFFIMGRARRNISGLAQLYSLVGHKTCYPYLYYPFFMHSLSLAPFDKLDRYFQRECMKEINPKAAAIPTTRDKLTSQHIIRRDELLRKKDIYYAKKSVISSKVREIFHVPVTRVWAFRAAALLGNYAVISGMRWRFFPLARFNDFLEWIGNPDAPSFPVMWDEPKFLTGRWHRDES